MIGTFEDNDYFNEYVVSADKWFTKYLYVVYFNTYVFDMSYQGDLKTTS
jgi:hypothetical protein